MQDTRVIICPSFNALFHSFYVRGLFQHFSGAHIRFSSRHFPPFESDKLAFIVQGKEEVRFFIDVRDRADLDPRGVAWCDVYGKVNLSRPTVPVDSISKVFPLGPYFPLQVWKWPIACLVALENYARARKNVDSAREHFANYCYRQFRFALREDEFEPGVTQENYVFSANALWKADVETNRHRIAFFDACRSLDQIEFEGGFTPRRRNDVPGFEKYTLPKRYSTPEYIEKTKRSAVVFNTPAVFECHGWKLGEYLALGKAIISTPLKRELPSPLIDGEHIHFVDASPENIREAIGRLFADRQYRARLEAGARAYYCEYLKPRRAIERLLNSSRAV